MVVYYGIEPITGKVYVDLIQFIGCHFECEGDRSYWAVPGTLLDG